ncbi:MAG: hydroxyacid aldolase [Rhodobacteraceae bacterium]|nr:hydroxyacid aldolase [Paracoccaceae bacterium]
MNSQSLSQKLNNGHRVITAWCSLQAPIVAELMARGGYEAVTVDMQHGAADFSAACETFSLLKLAGAHRVARIPVGEFSTASRLLDAGAELVIAPMINSKSDAEEFADAMKYPPIGKRSWGPMRAATLDGVSMVDYATTGNERTLALAMIETREAFDCLDDILAVPGIDGVFVGPSDLSLTLSNGANLDPLGQETMQIASQVAARTKAAGKIAGAFCLTQEHHDRFLEDGFSFLAYGVDMALILDAVGAQLASVSQKS